MAVQLIKKGEVREVAIEVISRVGDLFVIDGADYEIRDANGLTVQDGKGQASIDGHKIITLFSTVNLEKGKYTVIFTYRISPEILIGEVQIEIR